MAWMATAAAILCFALPGSTSWAATTARGVLDRAVEAPSLLAESPPGWRIEHAAVLHGSGPTSVALAIAAPRPEGDPKP